MARTRRHISVSGAAYDLIREAARNLHITGAALVERAVVTRLDAEPAVAATPDHLRCTGCRCEQPHWRVGSRGPFTRYRCGTCSRAKLVLASVQAVAS